MKWGFVASFLIASSVHDTTLADCRLVTAVAHTVSSRNTTDMSSLFAMRQLLEAATRRVGRIALENRTGWIRCFSSYPAHEVVGLPSLSPVCSDLETGGMISCYFTRLLCLIFHLCWTDDGIGLDCELEHQ